MNDKPFVLASSPHLRDRDSVPRIMGRVILSLVPAIAASLWFFGPRAALLYVACVASCLGTEAAFFWARRKPMASLADGSAVITGLLLAMCLPVNLPPGMAVIGGVVAIGLGKQVFGGLGHNIFNPALVGRAFLATAFPAAMTTWLPPRVMSVDAVTFATPLAGLKFHEAVSQGNLVSIKDLFLGNVGGTLGGTSALAVLLGGAYLLSRRTINWRIPAGIIVSLALFTGAFWLADPVRYASPLFHIFSGGLLLGAFFMATDMVTSPLTPLTTWIYAAGIGLVSGLIRLFGGFPEGIMYAILFMNAFLPLLNITLRPRILGSRWRPK